MEQSKKSIFLHVLKPRYRVALIAMLLILGMVFAMGSSLHTTHAAPADGSVYGCPKGYACIYPGKDANNNVPQHKYYYYGVYKLHNEYGYHYIVNNQYDGAIVRLCTDWNGKNCPTTMQFDNGGAGLFNLSPINSIVLLAKG